MRVARVVVAACSLAVLPAGAAVPAGAEGDFQISAGTSAGGSFGESIGLDFSAGRLVAAWADNSDALAGNPDPPALDVAFAAVTGGVVGANVNVTASPQSQLGVSVAVDPTDPDRLVAAAIDGSSEAPSVVRAFSGDGGATWTTVRGLPGNFGGYAPSVAFDAFGDCFLALVHDPDFGNPRLELFVSTDGGATFTAVPLPERPGLETNVSVAAGSGAVWVALQSFDGIVRIRTLAAPVTGPGQVGAFTLQTLPGSEGGRAPDVALRPGGAAVVTYAQGEFTQTPTVNVQLDEDGLGEAGFGPRLPVANVPPYPNLPRPKVAVDGASGRIYLVYPDRQEADGPEEVRLNFTDDGVDWSAAITVNDAAGSPARLLPVVAVDGSGDVGVAWYDFRSGGAQLWGNVRSAVERPAYPRAPLSLLAAADSQSSINLSWTDTSDDEEGFQVQRRTDDPLAEPVIVAELPAGTTTWSDTGLPADTAFVYRVRAVNAAGASLWSNGASATTLAFPPPAPQDLVATAVTFQRIDLAWGPVEGADSYEVQQSSDGVTFTTIRRPTGTQIMIFGLQPSTTYFFRVAAVNSGGVSPWSAVTSATTLDEDQPVAPSELRATALSSSRIRLDWRDNSVNETRFEIQRSTGGGAFAHAGWAHADAQRFTDSGLRRATTYTYRLRACNGNLCSPFSNLASATTPGH
jgi:hypothetical protein